MANRGKKGCFLLILVLLAGLVILFAFLKNSQQSSSEAEYEVDAYQFPQMTTLELLIGEFETQKLKNRRDHAVEIGVLNGEDKKWVVGKIKEGKREFDAKIRLKGDWTDHLAGNKWSFRIHLKNDAFWRRIDRFSVQNPKTRGFLREWIFHKAMLEEGVLTTRYDFIHLKLNGSNLGNYAIEEHFGKTLLESQGRREGVIVKMDEAGLWEGRVHAGEATDDIYDPMWFYTAALTLPFGKKRILASPELSAQFDEANKLMHQYRFGLAEPAQIFDLKKWAQFYALVDLFRAYHCLIWHNRRMYYNPILQKLEPVAFDAFSGMSKVELMAGPFTGFACNGNTQYGNRLDILGTTFFKDDAFIRSYYHYLQTYSSEAFVDQFLLRSKADIDARESMMRQEFWTYSFDREKLTNTAWVIRKSLAAHLKEELLTIERQDFEKGESYFCIQNTSPIAIEFWQESKGEQSAKLLDAYDGVHTPEFADFRISSDDAIHYRIPESKTWKVLKR